MAAGDACTATTFCATASDEATCDLTVPVTAGDGCEFTVPITSGTLLKTGLSTCVDDATSSDLIGADIGAWLGMITEAVTS